MAIEALIQLVEGSVGKSPGWVLRDHLNSTILPTMSTNRNSRKTGGMRDPEDDTMPGVGMNSCTAAVAVVGAGAGYKLPSFPTGMVNKAGQQAYVFCGSSQMFRGLVPLNEFREEAPCRTCGFSAREEHAEQMAIGLAEHYDLGFWEYPAGYCHLYVDYSPCEGCYPWLDERNENWIIYYSAEFGKRYAMKKYGKQRREWADEMQGYS